MNKYKCKGVVKNFSIIPLKNFSKHHQRIKINNSGNNTKIRPKSKNTLKPYPKLTKNSWVSNLTPIISRCITKKISRKYASPTKVKHTK
jgi:hypothetical protein